MTKLIAIAALVMVLSGCSEPNTTRASYSGFNRICVDNVEYLMRYQGYNGYMAPHFKPDGSLYTCN